PSPASPATVKPSAASAMARPMRNSGWSSTIATRGAGSGTASPPPRIVAPREPLTALSPRPQVGEEHGSSRSGGLRYQAASVRLHHPPGDEQAQTACAGCVASACYVDPLIVERL